MPTPHQFFSQLAQRLTRSFGGRRSGQRGFVLPVAILIALVLSLVTVGLLTRSTQRNFQTQVERAGQVVTSQVNTAIDRARAKIDFLINDPRLPRSTPSDALLSAALINQDVPDALIPALRLPPPPDPDSRDPYVLPDETRFIISTAFEVPNPDFDPLVDPPDEEFLDIPVQSSGWWFEVDTDGDGNNDSVTAYTILTNRRSTNDDPGRFGPEPLNYENDQLSDEERANRLLIRGGPLQGAALEGCVDLPTAGGATADTGDWFQVGSRLFKPFQVYAVTIPTDGASATTRALSAIQFQQDRQRDVLNKWGAFSRSDVEFFLTPRYNWNGAIYAGGSLFFLYGPAPNFQAYLISSEGSCFYLPPENSEIKTFGELVAGSIGYNFLGAGQQVLFDGHPGERNTPPDSTTVLAGPAQSSVDGTARAQQVALDPLALLLEGNARRRDPSYNPNPTWDQSPVNVLNTDPAVDGRVEAGQFRNDNPRQLCPPYVDDTYRADNRFGPKPSYERPPASPVDADPPSCDVQTFTQVYGAAAVAGADIETVVSPGPLDPPPQNTDDESLIDDEPPAGDLAAVGLDGYWERRARREGLRVIVGQRLDLTRSDSNPIPLTAGLTDPRDIQPTLLNNEERQRLTLRDNPAAVQAAAVYHYSQNNGNYPLACLAMVAHPGSPESLRRASSFPNGNPTEGINFFTGTGTNVWEFEPPSEGDLSNDGSDLMVALRNLAFYAGDLEGAYPPQQAAGEIRPDPFVTSFGNFSNLRRLFNNAGLVTPYDDLSLADRTTLQTAGCALGMLAWNIEQIDASTTPDLAPLRASIRDSRNGDLDSSGNPCGGGTADPACIQTADVQAGNQIGFERLLDDPASQRLYLPLWYLFPQATFATSTPTPAANHSDRDPAVVNAATEPNAGATLIRRNFSNQVDTTYIYSSVNLANVSITPRNNINNWILPHVQQNCESATAGPNSSRFEFIQIGNQCHRVPFKDTVIYDGREALAVRAMNIDLSLLVDQARNAGGAALTVDNNRINGDTWLPDGSIAGNGISISEGGIFYAFREDAVREDAIARPALNTFGNFLTAWNNDFGGGDVGDGLTMNAGQPGRAAVGDPPLEPTTRLSPKPVDYYPDPDRRPYGFRLKNGDILRRGGVDPDLSVFGLSFISDNPVYIQGDFNLHQTDAGERLEEFQDLVTTAADGTFDNFYGRQRVDEDRRFARASEDNWRPTDVVADSVNILSENFCDGSIDDGFLQDGTLNQGGNSYNPDRDYQNGRTSAPRREENYGCLDAGIRGADALGNTSFINQALVFRGNNWPANDPNDTNAGVRRFDTTNGAQELGFETNRPGHPEVWSRETPILNLNGTPDATVGNGVPQIRDLRAPDETYVASPTRISTQGNPVLDTSRWLQTSLICPRPDQGGGLLAEYYNGWIRRPDQTDNSLAPPAPAYDRTTGFEQGTLPNPASPAALNTGAADTNLQFLRGVRWPDPANGSPNAFRFDWNVNQQLFDQDVVANPNTGMTSCPFDDTDIFTAPLLPVSDLTNFSFLRSCWSRVPGNNNNSGNNNGTEDWVIRWVGQLFPLFGGEADYRILNQRDGAKIVIRDNPLYTGPPVPSIGVDDDGVGSGVASWTTGNNRSRQIEGNRTPLECSPVGDQSPYLIELQVFRNNDNNNGAVILETRPNGTPNFVTYPLDYLLPIEPANGPCLNPGDTPTPGLAQRDCFVPSTACVTGFSAFGPACNPALCTATPLTQSRTVTSACPGGPPVGTVETRTITCPAAGSNTTCGPFNRGGCSFPAEAGQTITRSRTCTTTSLCTANNTTFTDTRTITCSNNCTDNFGPFDNSCNAANGGTTITRTRTGTRTCQDGTTTPITDTQTQACPLVCNYGPFSPYTPECSDDPRSGQCGGNFTITQSRQRTLNAATSSPGCPATDTQTRSQNCSGLTGPICTEVFLPPNLRPDSPLRDPGVQAATPTDQGSLPLRMAKSVVDWFLGEPAHAAQRGGSVLINGVADPRRPAGIAPAQVPGDLADLQATLATLGIAYNADLTPLTVAQEGEFARAARAVFMQCPFDDDDSEPLIDAISTLDDGGFFVPGVFAPNFNTTFGYTSYNGDSIPSTLRFTYGAGAIPAGEDPSCPDGNGDGQLTQAERQAGNCGFRPVVLTYGAAAIPAREDPACPDLNTDGQLTQAERQAGNCSYRSVDGAPVTPLDVLFDRDPLFGFDANRDGDLSDVGEIQPQMYLNPYARVRNNDNQAYATNTTYLDGYYIDDVQPQTPTPRPGSIRNGLCFYVRTNGAGVAQVRIDRNGNSGGNLAWVDVESISRDNSQPSTGYRGTNPLLAVVLDERTRRPIPIPQWDDLVPTANNRRKRGDRVGATIANNQLIPAAETRVNTIAVSGNIPPRLQQPNGGIPNFLRLNELWFDIDLFFGGSLIELNYSTAATAPLFQQSFEPFTVVPLTGQFGFDYYFPPNRRFGYDVALQVARSISPVSARFEFPSAAVSEFLQDLPPQDPYVRRLRCALQDFIGSPENAGPNQLSLDPFAVLPDIECDAFDNP